MLKTWMIVGTGLWISVVVSACASPAGAEHIYSICDVAKHKTELVGTEVRISSDYETNGEYGFLENRQCPNVLIPLSDGLDSPSGAAKEFQDYIDDRKSYGKTKPVRLDLIGIVRNYDDNRTSTKLPGGSPEFYIELVDVVSFKTIVPK
jgi:hypothetical protein